MFSFAHLSLLSVPSLHGTGKPFIIMRNSIRYGIRRQNVRELAKGDLLAHWMMTSWLSSSRVATYAEDRYRSAELESSRRGQIGGGQMMCDALRDLNRMIVSNAWRSTMKIRKLNYLSAWVDVVSRVVR